jgi:hypothetical protein
VGALYSLVVLQAAKDVMSSAAEVFYACYL